MTGHQPRSRVERAMGSLLVWRRHNFKENRFMLLLALIVGVLTALAGLLLKWIIEVIRDLLTNQFSETHPNVLYLVYPVVGIWLTSVFIRRVVRDNISHGVTQILFAIARKQSSIKAHNCWSSLIASAITIGFGGSVGAEAPIVLTGSAIGSNLGRLFRMDRRQLMLLVGCGAAGAIAGIFKAPIAGLVFVLEVLMIDLTMASLLPLLVSCVTAAGITFALTGMDTLFSFVIDEGFTVQRFPAYILLGIVCGLVSLYFTRTMNGIENVFHRFRGPYTKLAVGGLTLSVLIFLFPSLYGEGYDFVDLLLRGSGEQDWASALNHSIFYGHSQLLLLYLAMLILFKVFATASTNCGGGCGGIFAPSLFLGCVSGFFFARVWNMYDPLGITVVEKNFAMLGMCGLMSGVMHAPLTGIFLIAELTGGYELFMPLMVVSVCAYLTIVFFEPHSIYAMRLARRGELLTHHKDHAVLTLMSLDSVLDRYSRMLRPDDELGELVRQVANSRHNVFPVVDAEKRLAGVLNVDDIRHVLFRPELYQQFTVGALMSQPQACLTANDSMEIVVHTFERTAAAALPVVDIDGHFIGFISKSRLLGAYRQMMADISDE
ncbi:MAG: chloride channel protein [Prevotellaceae bacterium]|nr:chloride channel protein [Prevotellaceae bacterium]